MDRSKQPPPRPTGSGPDAKSTTRTASRSGARSAGSGLCRWLFFCWLLAAAAGLYGQYEPADTLERELEDSLVFIQVAAYPYDDYHPWRHVELQRRSTCGCAVGASLVLTTASSVTDAMFIRTRRFGQNEFINARVLTVDYDSNLCLLELDRQGLTEPLKPLTFSDTYRKGAPIHFYWLSSSGKIQTGQGHLEDHRVMQTALSHTFFLQFIAGNISQASGSAQVFFLDGRPIGIAAAFQQDDKEARIIPAERIAHFLADAADGQYAGFPTFGFDTEDLLDPTFRSFLKMPADRKDGIYVRDVHTLGTASRQLQPGDVLLAVDGVRLDARGRWDHPRYGPIGFPHRISAKTIGEPLDLEIWRSGKSITLQAPAERFDARQMLVPFYQFDRQPEYIVTGGFVFQKLTVPYLKRWGANWEGKVDPHLYHYLKTQAYKPTDQRRDIVILSHVLPADFNQGYHELRYEVVRRVNGRDIATLGDILTAKKLHP
ncbi:MAG: hypothetical protein JW810_06905, partial [Sedimentisphaerales bacterium]|nr:hypothetical protein [Sedimentisphaerales bacterium]